MQSQVPVPQSAGLPVMEDLASLEELSAVFEDEPGASAAAYFHSLAVLGAASEFCLAWLYQICEPQSLLLKRRCSP